ncbi:DUF1643 domain-containing protein [Myxococcus sp. CA040A]|uniref:DUF1643 domain-containing protein n=1 Tax=Myxococcus sp. CA040A TaxID=2741738 RepID=UPI00157A6AEA|nr:DUF1643 domain-containing protein [Myxococcus sp. CA040A]NTX08277.1 DUF1643 domain-containing protein [Myxococcus sp. CA040A]
MTACANTWAVLSEDRCYRYVLGRRWSDAPALVIIGHNPSTADEKLDDNTIRKEVGFAKRWGFGALVKGNLCAWRATDPDALTLLPGAVGPDNDAWLAQLVSGADFGQGAGGAVGRVMAAWGTLHAESKAQVVRERPRPVLRVLTAHADVYAFKVTKDGHPQHPLYLPNSTEPVLFRAKAGAA